MYAYIFIVYNSIVNTFLHKQNVSKYVTYIYCNILRYISKVNIGPGFSGLSGLDQDKREGWKGGRMEDEKREEWKGFCCLNQDFQDFQDLTRIRLPRLDGPGCVKFLHSICLNRGLR